MTVDEYIAGRPAAVQPALVLVRAAIRRALPEAQESISYQMPTYTAGGRVVIYFAGWKAHYSLYPASGLLPALAGELAPYKVEKGTIRFPLGGRVPVKLIGRIAKARAALAASGPQRQR